MTEAIVMDMGSRSLRVGFSGDESPSVVQSKIGGRSLVERGVVVDWDAVEEIWAKAFHGQLKVDPSTQPLLLGQASAPSTCPKAGRERAAEVSPHNQRCRGTRRHQTVMTCRALVPPG
jgi:actin-related protein